MGGNVFLQDVIRDCNVQFSDSKTHELPLHPNPLHLMLIYFASFLLSKSQCHPKIDAIPFAGKSSCFSFR